MKKIKLFALLLSLLTMFFLVSCDDGSDDDDGSSDPIDYTPVLDEDFTVSVNGNDVSFSTTLSTTAWFINCTTGVQLDVTDGVASTTISNKGTYPFTCNTLVSGVTYTSDTFNVEIESTDLSYLDEGLWKALTGGSTSEGKTWVLDDFMSDGGNEYNKLFSSAVIYYVYYEDENDGTSSCYSGHNFYAGDWTGNFGSNGVNDSGPEIGSITFDGANLSAKLSMSDGWNFESQSFTSYEDETSFVLTLQDEEYGFKSTLATSCGVDFSSEWATLKFTSPVRMPMDKGRVAAGEYTSDDAGTIYNVSIISCTDSALCVAVERVYEVTGEESYCILLYNYVCADYTYTYDDPDAFVAPDRPATSGTLEDGTYKLAEIPGFYYDWSSSALCNTWETLDAYKINMAEWWCIGNPSETMTDGALNDVGTARWDAAYGAYSSQTIEVSGSDITVNYKGIDVWGDNPTEQIDSTYTTTFTVSEGVITFANPIALYTPNAAFDDVSELYIISDIFSSGIAIGEDNIDEDNQSYQTKLQNWIKQ